jgi:hypothetical protein
VHAHDVRAPRDGERERRQRALQPLFRGQPAQQMPDKRLTRSANQDGVAQRLERRQMAQQLQVVFHRLAEADARVQPDVLARDARLLGALGMSAKRVAHFGNHIGVMGAKLHGARRALNMHQHDQCACLCCHFRHARVEGHPADVVDDARARLQRKFGDAAFGRVDGEDSVRVARRDCLDDGEGASQFLVFGHGFCARAGRFAADVEDVRTFGEHLFGACERGLERRVPAAVVEAVRRRVQHAHDERACIDGLANWLQSLSYSMHCVAGGAASRAGACRAASPAPLRRRD